MPRNLSKWILLALTLVTFSIAGCGDDDEEVPIVVEDSGLDGTTADVSSDGGGGGADADVSVTPPADADASTSTDADAAATADADARAADADASDSDALPLLTDNQIVTVLHTANVSEIQEANLALAQAVATQARTYANQMFTDHTAEDLALLALYEIPDAGDAAALDSGLTADGGLPINESWASRQIVMQAVLSIAQLTPLSGRPFDLAYMSDQVAFHSSYLQLIDSVLTPQSQNTALKAQLAAIKTTEMAHLANAIAGLNAIALNQPD